MNRKLALQIGSLAGAMTLLMGCTSSARSTDPVATAGTPAPREAAKGSAVSFSCPGRVEGASETVEVGASTDGVIRGVFVTEGQLVKKGAVVAAIACPELPAELAQAEAEVERARQIRTRVERGSREEERLGAEQRVVAAKATLEEAKSQLDRMKYLVGHGAMAQNVLDRAVRDHDVAVARLNEAKRNEDLVRAAALPEDLAKADAEIHAALERVDLVKRRIGKCNVVAPMDGTVLRVLLKPGESFSTITPRPILTMADLSGRRIRAEIDERDVAKVGPGQKVMVELEGEGSRKLAGTVSTMYGMMGRKRIRSGDPSEKADRDVLEALVDLEEANQTLPVGLRVVLRFEKMR